MEQKNIEKYIDCREKYVNKCRNNSNFRRAIEEMDSFISDPEKYRSNAVARVIKIKSEADIQRHLGIKVELKSNGDDDCQTEAPTPNDNLIDEIVKLKSENQHVCFELNKKSMELTKIKKENEEKVQQLNEEIAMISSKLNAVEAEAIKFKKIVHIQQAVDKKNIADLTNEKKVLTARIKQLQSGALLNSSNAKEKCCNDDPDPDVFEVDKVLADKLVGKTRYYLVSWKGYTSKDDTWEKSSNLYCPSILEEYNKSKQN